MATFTLDIISGKAFIFNKNFNVSGTTVSVGNFNTYTASTQPNEIQLIHTGETQVNNIIPTALDWNIVQYSGNSYNYTGGSTINITETDDYIISYNILLRNQTNREKSLGSNLIINNNTIVDKTTAATSIVKGIGKAAMLVLSNVKVELTSGDKVELIVFRNGDDGSVTTIENSSTIHIRKGNTLQ